MPQTHNNFLWF